MKLTNMNLCKAFLIFTLIGIVTNVTGQVILNDGFTAGNKHGWKSGEESGIVIRTIDDGSFQIKSLKSGSYPYTVIPVDIDLKKYFEISTAITSQNPSN